MNFNNKNVKQINEYLKNLDDADLSNVLQYLKDDERTSVKKLVNTYQNKIQKHESEILRIQEMSKYENDLFDKGLKLIAGVDEAGRGPLAGPVYAAAVIFPKGTVIEGINDSKKISAQKREELYEVIIEKALYYSISSVSPEEIDNINISNASMKAMGKAVLGLDKKPDYLLVDGNNFNQNLSIPYTCIIKGDSLSISIAAASILAKVSRDRLMVKYDSEYPEYGFLKHKGYGTKEHIEMIKKYGLTPIHRKTFVKNI